MASGTATTNRDGLEQTVAGYSDEHRPLAGYTTLTGIFAAGFAGSLLASRASGRELPESIGLRDIAVIGLATHKLSRLISKDRVTSFLRAPFVRYQEDEGHGEVSEQPRGEGIRLATGELLVCPYCLAQWVAAGFGVGLVAAPRLTRLIAAIYAAEATSDFMQLAYKSAEDHAA
jgi:hypothetical protein